MHGLVERRGVGDEAAAGHVLVIDVDHVVAVRRVESVDGGREATNSRRGQGVLTNSRGGGDALQGHTGGGIHAAHVSREVGEHRGRLCARVRRGHYLRVGGGGRGNECASARADSAREHIGKQGNCASSGRG